jgi:hypothetical protein
MVKNYWYVLLPIIVTVVLSGCPPVFAQFSNYSLRFYGHGVSDIDRVKISIEPHVPADISSDFTLEFWLKASPGENASSSCTPGDVNWIYGNIILDRDIYGDGDYGDYGVSLSGGRIAFGVAQGSNAQTICSTANVADGMWHHIALTRDGSTGQMRIFVDGILDATGSGPIGDISYRDGRTTSYPNSDPYLVIGAEKHDAGSSYPSYSGFLDELRISTIIRYTSNFTPPTAPFTVDGQTAALYHFDEGPVGGCTGTIVDAAGSSPGQCKYGGSAPSGPVYSSDTPFGSSDTTSPSVSSVIRADPTPTSASSVNFTVIFSEAVTGVDPTDFTLTVTGTISGASVTGISGSASTYTVTVNTGTGDGTLRLDVSDNDTILDTASNPLGGPGVGNGNFSDGEIYDVIKTSPFVVSILRFDPVDKRVTSGDTITYRVTFSKAVTGVDASDFSLSLLSVPGVNASISSVTPVNASTYDVTVDVTGIRNTANKRNGAIRLDIPATAVIQDTAANPLAALPYTSGQIYSIVQQQTFLDVPTSHPFWLWIEELFYSGITSGCSSNNYCPVQPVSRAQMAVFLLRGKYGAAYTPPPVGSSTGFNDVPVTHPLAAWIKQLAVEGITSGCGGGNYCPNAGVTRAHMAVFLLRAKYGSSYMPPPVGTSTGFIDVSVSHPLARWIKQLAAEGITSGCDSVNYCPDFDVTRGQMAVFLVRTFDLPHSPSSPPTSSAEWSQHAHDAQHTSYTAEVVSYPWRWKWVWNGSNSSGGVSKVTTSGILPRNVQPVTGGGRVYVAAGVDGVFALSENNGQVLWQQNALGDVRSTVAYDADTQAIFVVSANGRLYKLDASNGNIIAQFNSGQSSNLPLPPALAAGRVFFSMGNSVYALNKYTLELVWNYDAGAIVAVPPAYSPSRDILIIATEPDLYVHAVRNSDGNLLWRVRPVPSSLNFSDPTEYRLGWPVIAENAGLVLIKVRLHWERLWRDWPQTNPEMRQLLINNPGDQALFVLDLDDGSIPFIANVGHGGYGDTDYLPMGPQPVVKPLGNGKDVVYTIIRAKHAYDSRWDSHFGEMVLDNSTVSGLQGGYVRFIAFDWPPGSNAPFLLTDEQPNVTMAGDYLFGGHWEAGFALQILDRSPGFGTFTVTIQPDRILTNYYRELYKHPG